MFLDLNKIGLEGLEFDQALKLPALEGAGGEVIAVLRARLTGEVQKGKRGFDLTGHLDALVTLTCGRCTESFNLEIVRDFFLTLVARGSEAKPRPEYDEDQEAAIFCCPEGRADFLEMVGEQIYLNLPLKPICREGCKGLCPTCGANRNVVDCGCRSETADPRLATLLQFKNRQRS